MSRSAKLLRDSVSCRAIIIASATTLGLAGFGRAADAQQTIATGPAGGAAGGTPPASTQLGEVVVTAQRRSERLQDVPIAITAVSGARLTATGITNTSQLSQVTPGLVTPDSVSGNASFTPFIRGIGSGTALPGIDASVALYIDGVYQASKYLNQVDLANIDRVEVLKGPQGTLYGRNATGGAINIITKQPSDVFSASGSVSYGRFDATEEKGYVNGPLANNLDANVSIVAHQGGDYVRNFTTGDEFGGLTSLTVNPQLEWKPVDRLAINLSAIYADRQGREFDDSYAFAPGVVPPGGQFGGQFSTNPREAYLNSDPTLNARSYSEALHVRYSFSGMDLVTITADKQGNYRSLLDSDATSLPILSINFAAPSKEFTQELHLVSTSPSPFQWIVGAYFIDSYEDYNPFGVITAPTPVAYYTRTGTQAESVFGQGTYAVTPTTKLTVGLRYSIERRSINASLVAPTLGNFVIGGPVDKSQVFEKPTWRFSLEQKLLTDVMAYASYNRGFKSGAYNPLSVDPTLKAVSPEILDAYELGLKSQLLDRKLQVNVSGYYYDYKNIQVQHVILGSGSSVAVLENAAAATLYGIDGDVAFLPTPALRLNGGFNLEHSRYDSYENASGFALAGGAGVAAAIDETGQQVLGAPDLTFSTGANYRLDLGGRGDLIFDANYAFSSYFKISPGAGNFVRPYGLLNSSVAYTDPSSRYKVEVWGRNLTDVEAYGQYTTALANSLAVRPPTTYGVTLSASF